jgi:hypothetical protein
LPISKKSTYWWIITRSRRPVPARARPFIFGLCQGRVPEFHPASRPRGSQHDRDQSWNAVSLLCERRRLCRPCFAGCVDGFEVAQRFDRNFSSTRPMS